MSHTPSCSQNPKGSVRSAIIHKGHKVNLILRNPSVAPGKKKTPLLQTQGLPEGTGKVINSLRFSQNTFEERQRVTSRVGKTVILKHCKHAGRQSCLPRLPQLYRSQDIASASKLKVVLSWIQLRSHRTVLSWQLRHKPPPALSLWP